MKINLKVLYLSLLLFLPVTTFAQNVEERTILENLITSILPMFLFVAILWVLLKNVQKNSKATNEKLLESNLAIARELKRIADHFERK